MCFDDEALDSKGIPGWDKVDALARALLDLHGLAVTTSQAREIQKLYACLDEYDKKPLQFKTLPTKPLVRGRFALARSRKYHTGLLTVDAMKRYSIKSLVPCIYLHM